MALDKWMTPQSASGKSFRFLAWGALCFLLGVLASAAAAGETARYVDHGDQTVTDTQTGLMWQRLDAYLDTGHWMNWYESFDYVDRLNREGFGGYSDWRLPTVRELRTLYEADKTNGRQVGREMVIHMDPVFEPNGGGAHWSSESNGRFNAFGLVFNTGRRFSAPKNSKSRKSVRAVRNHMDPPQE